MPTKIEWCEEVWNPVVGCTKVSEGCRHCYAERMAKRLRAMKWESYQGVVDDRGRWTGKVDFVGHDVLDKPLRWQKPRTVFVNSMSDLFHPSVDDELVAWIWSIMYRTPEHRYLILTKRPERMHRWLSGCGDMFVSGYVTHDGTMPAKVYDGSGIIVGRSDRWPLSNVGLGVSVEDHPTAVARVTVLLKTLAAMRFVSYEPALGPVAWTASDADTYYQDWLSGEYHTAREKGWKAKLDWVIMGGESGPGARPMHPDLARNTRDACSIAGVPFFFKQWGEWAPGTEVTDDRSHPTQVWTSDGWEDCGDDWQTEEQHGEIMYRVGKKAAGARLDGREWRERPEWWWEKPGRTECGPDSRGMGWSHQAARSAAPPAAPPGGKGQSRARGALLGTVPNHGQDARAPEEGDGQ